MNNLMSGVVYSLLIMGSAQANTPQDANDIYVISAINKTKSPVYINIRSNKKVLTPPTLTKEKYCFTNANNILLKNNKNNNQGCLIHSTKINTFNIFFTASQPKEYVFKGEYRINLKRGKIMPIMQECKSFKNHVCPKISSKRSNDTDIEYNIVIK